MTAPEIKPSRLVTPAQHQLFDMGYAVGMHVALHDQGLIPEQDVLDEMDRDQTATLHGAYEDYRCDDYAPYWLGRQVGYDIGHSPAIVACFAAE